MKGGRASLSVTSQLVGSGAEGLGVTDTLLEHLPCSPLCVQTSSFMKLSPYFEVSFQTNTDLKKENLSRRRPHKCFEI